MRVSVLGGSGTVSCPSRMTHPRKTCHRRLLNLKVQVVDSSDSSIQLEGSTCRSQSRHTRAVVSPIFQSPKASYEKRSCIILSDVTNNSTHFTALTETQLNVDNDRDDRRSLRQRHRHACRMIQLHPSFRKLRKVTTRLNSYNRQVTTAQPIPMDLELRR